MSPEAQGADPPEASPRGDARLAQLIEQEQLWFSWLTVLHERLDKTAPEDSRLEVLEIATRHWVEAKIALQQYTASN